MSSLPHGLSWYFQVPRQKARTFLRLTGCFCGSQATERLGHIHPEATKSLARDGEDPQEAWRLVFLGMVQTFHDVWALGWGFCNSLGLSLMVIRWLLWLKQETCYRAPFKGLGRERGEGGGGDGGGGGKGLEREKEEEGEGEKGGGRRGGGGRSRRRNEISFLMKGETVFTGDFPLHLIGQDWIMWLPLAVREAGKANISLAQPLSMKLREKEWRSGLYPWTNNPTPQLFQISFQLTHYSLLFHYIQFPRCRKALSSCYLSRPTGISSHQGLFHYKAASVWRASVPRADLSGETLLNQ